MDAETQAVIRDFVETTPHFLTAIEAVTEERVRQLYEERYTLANDDAHDFGEWIDILSNIPLVALMDTSNRDEQRRAMVQIAATAIAAIESIDRQKGRE